MMFFKIWLGILLISTHYVGAADTALDSYFNHLKSLQGQFQQTVYDEKGLHLETSSGEFSLQRPGKFYWQYTQPYQQLIVANGIDMWIYEADLSQATHKTYQASLMNTPLILFTQQQPLSTYFNIKQLTTEKFELNAKTSDQGFKSMIVSLSQGEMQQLELHDNLGQRTEIIFTAQKRNRILNTTIFDFIPPKGTDIIED